MGTPYDDQKRAAALAALLAGQSVSQVARDYHVSRQSVMAWRDKAGITATPVGQQKRDEIGELVNDVLNNLLITVSVLSERARNEEWFNRQDASEVAVLSGVYMDKAIRLLEALESAGSADLDRTAAPEAP